MLNILVTGGAGYIGSILVPQLLGFGHKVTVVDNLYYNQNSLLDVCANENFSFVRGDARDKETMAREILGKDVIIPLACLVGAPLCKEQPLEATSINFDAIELIMSLRSEDQKIIFPTTNSGYGVGQEGIFCTEETPLNPISLYGRLKTDIEQELLESKNTITLRLATVFGSSPRMRIDLLVNDFVYRAINDRSLVLFEAHFKRNFIHIRDVANAFIHCIDNFETMKNEAYNVGLSDANLSKMELCELIKEQLPNLEIIEAELGEDPDKRNYIVSNEKIEKTGFRPQHSLVMGISELIKTFSIIKRNSYGNI